MNGVRQLTDGSSPITLFEDGDSGQRGFAAVQPIANGQRLLAVPLRLALRDYAGDPDAEVHGLTDAPWAVRLAAKLLREVQLGPASQWAPYLQALPALVPQLSRADAEATEYSPLVRALEVQQQLASESFSRLPSDAAGGASLETFHWALAVVHSRTFGSAAEQGGVGVRMLMPLLDMLNHGGDEKAGTRLGHIASDSVRWDMVPPDRAAGAEWEMHLSATRDIDQGEEVLLSYGDRGNDDFLLHYGFVPPGNPHDSVLLFPSLEAALEWYFDCAAPQGDMPELQARQLYDNAQQAAAAAAAETPTLQGPELMLSGDCSVDPRLLAAFSALDPRGVAAALALRCEELLAGMAPVLQDLQQLVREDEEERGYWQLVLREQTAALQDLADSGSPALQTAGGSTVGVADAASDVSGWRRYVELLAGLGNGAIYTEAQDSLSASSPHMRRMLLRFRAAKKLQLWEILLVQRLEPQPELSEG